MIATILTAFLLTACGTTASRNASSASNQVGSDGLEISTSALPSGVVGTAYNSQLVAKGGASPYSWSVSNGGLPPGVALAASSGMLTGSPNSAGTYNVALSVQDSSNPPVVVAKSLPIQVSSSSSSGTENPSGIYGSGINADALNNITIGPHLASYRFLSTHTGTISKVHFYLIVDGPHAGYNSGSGGTLNVQLQTDDGSTHHNPSGTVLGTATITHPDNPFPIVSFSSSPKLTAGQLYHLVFSNTDPNPNENFVSVDNLYMAHPVSPIQPAFSNEDTATLLKMSGDSWGVYDYNTPIYEVDFTDGRSIGQGYMEVWPGAPQPISGSQSVRETFTVSGSERTVSKVSIRLARISGSGDLTVRLEQGDGNLVEQGTIPGGSAPLSSSGACSWVTYTFSSLRTLLLGQEYELILEAPSGTKYQAFPIRKGSAQNFQPTTYFPDGHAQFKSGSDWVGWSEWGVTNRTDGDLQFYFTEVN